MEDDGESLPRRAMLHGAAWSVPAISALSMSPAWAASPASLRFAHPAYPSFVGDQVRMEVQRVSGGSSVAVSLAYSSGVTGPDTVVLDGASAYFFVTVDVAGPSTVSALSGADVATTVINALPPTFEALRRRWRLARVGAALDTSQPIPAVVSSVSSRIASAAASASNDQRSMTLTGSSLWSALPLGSKWFNMTSSAGRLQTLAISLRTSTSSLENDVSAGESVVAGISRLLTLVYKRDANEYDNWWDWQIATPLALLSAAIIAYDFTTPLLRAALVDAVSGHTTDAAIASSTGANRAWMAEVRMLAALLVEDPALMDSARAGLMPVYDSVGSGDGFYDDGSFVQHGYVAYTGAYGLVLWSILADVTFLPAGSVWEISAATQAKMLARVDDSLFPLLFSGLVPDAVSGRLNSDFTSSDHTRGHGLLAAVLTFAEQVDASTASRWRSLAKHSAQLDSWLPIQSDNSLSIAQSARFSALLNDGTIIPSPPALGGGVSR